MAEIDGGGLHFTSTLDNDKLNKAIDETLRRVQGLSDGTVAGGKAMDSAFNKTADDINAAFAKIDAMTSEHLSEIKKLEAEYNALGVAAGGAYSKEIGSGGYRTERQQAIVAEVSVRKQLLKEIESASDALQKEEQALIANQNKAEQNANAQTSMRGRIRELKEEMMLLIDQGINEQSEAYKALEDELGRLTDIQSDVAQQARTLANDESMFQGVLSGIQGISGAFSAATGAVSMFSGENENLQKIMLKVQSLMAITIGLQQVAQTLNKDSAFQLVVVAKAKDILAAAETRFATALGISNIAAKALMATLTLGLSVAIGAVIYLWDKFSTKAKQAKEAQEELNKATVEGSYKQIASLQSLSYQWKQLGNDVAAQKKFLEENGKAIKDLTGKTLDLRDASKLFVDDTPKFIEALILRAKAGALSDQFEKRIKDIAEMEMKRDAMPDTVTRVVGGTYGIGGSSYEIANPQKAKLDRKIKDMQTLSTTLLQEQVKLSEQEKAMLNELGISSEKQLDGSIAEVESKISDLNTAFKEATNDSDRKKFSDELAEQQKLLEKLNPTKKNTSTTTKQKDQDPVLKEIEDKKKAYQDYFKWLDAGMKQEAQVEFASLIEKGKTYREYLQERLKDENLTWEQIYKLRDELASESDKTITQSFKESLQVQLDAADSVLERLDIIEQKRKELENDDSGLTKEKTEIVDKEKSEVDKEFEAESKNLLEQYKTFAQSRIDIEKQYQDQIKVMRKAGASEENIEIAKQAHDEAKAALDEEIAQKEATFNAFISRIGQMSLEQLATSLNEAEQALAASEATNGNNSKETATLRATIKRLQNEIKIAEAKKDLDDKDKSKQWDRTAKAIKKAKGEIDNMIDSMDFLDDTTKDALKAASNIADGAINMIDSIKMTAVAAGESISAVEKASVILAIIGLAVQVITAIFNMASKAEKAHQEALAEVQKNKLAMQHEYNLALLEQNLLLKEAETIFGTDNYRKAANAVNVYKDSLEQLDESMQSQYRTIDIFGRKLTYSISKLDAITVKTGHHKTGLFGWGKGEDEYTAITELYDDLITKEGTLNIKRAKAILDTQTMSDANKEALQNMIDLAEMAEKALEEMTGYLTDVFGELGSSMSDALTDAFRNGTDAAKAFSDSVSQMLERLAQDMIYSVTLAPIMEQAQQQMLDIMKNGTLTDEQRFNQYAALMGQVTEDAIAQKGMADELYKKYQEIANQNGIDIWKADSEKENTTLTGAVKGVTEETASMVSGQMNAMRINQMEATEILRQQLFHLANIDNNTLAINQNTTYNRYIKDIYDKISGNDSLRSQGLG
ncbi:hypothetical protein FACS189432_05040 [Bacteroidia bacterium]|nr:hypothetical protein FACS189426_06730 [Bacteroidia bacterium]GHT27872.1 hypothetical protein FACS189432_05040 [Bacteroidia bacterium]